MSLADRTARSGRGGRRVVITGLGMVSAFGLGFAALQDALRTGRSAVRPAETFDAAALPVRCFAELGEPDYSRFFDRRRSALWSRCSRAAVAAAALARSDAALEARDPWRTGVYLGTGYGCTYEMEGTIGVFVRGGAGKIPPMTVPRAMPNAPASLVAMEVGARAAALTVSTACSSGATAIAVAARALRTGELDLCFAGGADVYLNASSAASWCSMKVLSTRDDPSACRPFSVDRDGLVLGEGAAVLTLETLEHAEERGARIYAEVAGVGLTNDAVNLVAPDAEGEAAALRAALEDAGLEPGEIDYVNAHGTGTTANDVTETRALTAALGERARTVPVSSVKGHLGHTMGAAGAIEAAVTAAALTDGYLPPTLNLNQPDPECDLAHVTGSGLERPIRAALSSSFGFGGQNAVLVLTKAAEDDPQRRSADRAG